LATTKEKKKSFYIFFFIFLVLEGDEGEFGLVARSFCLFFFFCGFGFSQIPWLLHSRNRFFVMWAIEWCYLFFCWTFYLVFDELKNVTTLL